MTFRSSVSLLAWNMLLQDFREQQMRRRFALQRAREAGRPAGPARFAPILAPGVQPVCLGCRNYARSPMLVCAIHPEGPAEAFCRDCQPVEPDGV
ncbi:hypothetical protein [Gloeobacter kilaueensis]|uniref:Uncharacterized protein n=1 Tax=Gloeobacter kilaueensis (strain ATCC BAA-2537 / CCAP 1431/1 / ULC 316 / JS1) TaxID=1183438 RepID=U5QRJ6_GLOK1|nr:hypothetical protein [Gloeobacter kilaueensis]AGY60274.1 hypothetical protein GKIL_4028 [Gloeobacter kilaueensis JS1]